METKADIILYNIIRLFFALIGMWVIFSGAVFEVTTRFFPELHYSYDLGDNFYQLYSGEYTEIVFGREDGMTNNTCFRGTSLISYRQYGDTIFPDEYVEKYKFDDDFIIAKTASKKKPENRYYYILKKNYRNRSTAEISGLKVPEFTDSIEFAKACEAEGITLHF